jgi:predicted nucleotidyltransferase
MEMIMNHIDDLRSLCMKFHVGRLFVFGSAVSSSLKEDSDIDFLEEQAIKNPFLLKSIDSSKRLVYES